MNHKSIKRALLVNIGPMGEVDKIANDSCSKSYFIEFGKDMIIVLLNYTDFESHYTFKVN